MSDFPCAEEMMKAVGVSGKIEFCPLCGSAYEGFRRAWARLCKDIGMDDIVETFPPPYICMRCDFDMRRVTIAEEIDDGTAASTATKIVRGAGADVIRRTMGRIDDKAVKLASMKLKENAARRTAARKAEIKAAKEAAKKRIAEAAWENIGKASEKAAGKAGGEAIGETPEKSAK